MPFVSSHIPRLHGALGRPMVAALFVASCLLSIVSYYTTQQGMALYLPAWFSVLASFGIQTALVMVAWLIGFTRSRRALLVAVYAITGLVSIAFSYVSLYTWFSERERPAQARRALFDELTSTAAQAEQSLAEAEASARRYVLALEEMTEAERAHGYISRAQDSDPYLNRIREAVAKEAQTYAANYREGSGEGLRYTAFARHTAMTRQVLGQIEAARRSLGSLRASMNSERPSEEQLRQFHAVYDALPWATVADVLQQSREEARTLPAYSEFADRTSGGQEELLLAFQELLAAPTPRHVFAVLLAAFIDIVVFLLAFASGPYFFGEAEQRWCAASAALDSSDQQVFVRGLLRKVESTAEGLPRVKDDGLSAGERQLVLLLVSKGQAAVQHADDHRYYLLEAGVHERLLESLSVQGLPLRAERAAATAT